MSRRDLRPFAWLVAATLCGLIAVALAALWISCDPDDDSEGELDKYFLRDAAAMEEMGLPVYWLGTGFTVDGLVFRGPYGAEFGGEVEQGIGMSYLAPVDGGNTALGLTVRGRDAWARLEERVRNPGLPGVTRRMVTVGDREAELISIPLDTRPVNTLRLIFELDEVVVVASALAGGEAYPEGPDYDPFINNPDLLIQVMRDLRPYPE